MTELIKGQLECMKERELSIEWEMLRKGEREFRERRSLIKGKDGWIGGNGSVVLKEWRPT
jgi:hypothetical protein